MEEDEVSYETLQDLLRQEKRSNRLTPTHDGFWRRLQHFLQDIESEFLREQAKDPFSRKVSMLRDRVVHAQHAAESVWTLRERKIAMLALAHAKDGGNTPGLTKKEQILYDGLVDILRSGRRTIFAGTSVEDTYSAPRPTASLAGPDVPEVPEADADQDMEAVPEPPEVPAEVPADIPDDGSITIRALGDIPPFVGPDMKTYLLQEGDLASVPKNIAELLIKRGKAVALQMA